MSRKQNTDFAAHLPGLLKLISKAYLGWLTDMQKLALAVWDSGYNEHITVTS